MLTFTYTHDGGLNMNGPHRSIDLEAWSLGSGTT